MEEKLVFKQPFYQQAIKDFKEANEEIKRNIESGLYKKSALLEKADTLTKNIQKKLAEDFENLKSQIKKEQQSIEASHISKPTYGVNANEEILRRQDFDMRIDLMDVHELIAFVENAAENNSLSLYEFSRIKIKNEQITNLTHHVQIEDALNRIRDTYNIGQEWKNDSNYQKNEQLAADMRVIGTQMIWVPDNTGDYMPVDIYTGVSKGLQNYI